MKMKIDSGGIGADMAEGLSDYSWRVEPVDFTNPWKEEVCSDMRIRLEEQIIAIPNKKEVKNQIHSIKRKITESGKFIFDAEKNRSHHGDIFWAIAMGSSLGEKPVKRRIIVPSLGRDIVTPRARIIPISAARTFGRVNRPKVKVMMDMSILKAPELVVKFHDRRAA